MLQETLSSQNGNAGAFQQPSSRELIVIRHAQSQFNQGYLDYRRQHQLDLNWYECVKIPHFNTEVAYNTRYVDCGITPEGRLQCQIARNMLQEEEVDLVLVSPHQRALETCHEIFHDRGVKVEVLPLIGEVFRFSCDISGHIEQKRQAFPHFDFSRLDAHSELWFIEILSERLQSLWREHQGEMSYAQKQKRLLQLLQNKVMYESPQELRSRMRAVKQLLAEYRKKYKRIAIVSHFEVLESLLAKGYDHNGQTSQIQNFPNAVPFLKSIDDLLAVE